MTYFKSVLAGIAAFVLTVAIASAATTAFISHYPQLALRILPAQRHDLAWGSFYEVNFPSWQIVIVGLLAFGIATAWWIRRASARM